MADTILLIEDNAFDAKVFRYALRDAGVDLPVKVARDGVHALEILQRDPAGAEMLIVTDLKMPRMGGIELLRTIRSTEAIAHLPVFVVTTSSLPGDRDETLKLGIEGYVRKSGDEKEMTDPIVAYLVKKRGRTS
ncbi:MAG: response regulator [Alphaproteobacteria bacterium]